MEDLRNKQPEALLSELRQWLAQLDIPQTERQQAEAMLRAAEKRLTRGAAAQLVQEQLPRELDAPRRAGVHHATLYRVLRAVMGETDPDYVARAAVEAITKEAGWPNVILAVSNDEETHWVIRAASGVLSSTTRRRYPMEQGVVGRAFRTGQTQLVPDVQADPDYIAGNPNIRSELAVPIRRGGRTLGVLNLESDRIDAFDTDEAGLVELLADALALALDTARLYSEVHRNAANLSALYIVTRVASQSLVLQEVLSQALSSAVTLLGFEAGLIGLADPTGGRLRVAAEQGLPPALSERLRSKGLEDTFCAKVYTAQEGLVVRDMGRETAAEKGDVPTTFIKELANSGLYTYVGVPLLHQRQSLGSLNLFSRRLRPSVSDDLTFLTSIGHQLATAVANARLFETIASERSRLQALIETSRDGIMLIGTDARVLIINAPALELLGLQGEATGWINRPVQEVVKTLEPRAPALVKWARTETDRIEQGDQQPGEGELEVPPRTLRVLNLPVMAGKALQGWLLVLRDVTEERLLERMRKDLTHTMVHDLRNPLGNIFTSLLLVEKGNEENLSADQRFLLKVARDSSERMLKLVDDILTVSRLESGRMQLQRAPVALDSLVAGTLQTQAPLAAEKELDLESRVPPALPSAWADSRLIERVLQNLVDNAIKFTPSGGRVEIAARQREQVSGFPFLEVSVADNGPGIPAGLRDRVFQKFVTGGQEGSGSGLGLAFCKLVVEAHRGGIWVESEPGQGATFTFTLPVARADRI